MTDKTEKTAIAQKGSRVLILFGIFSICVAAAWWMAKHRESIDMRQKELNALWSLEGENVITEMRQKKLSAFWGEEDSTQWCLIRSDGKNVGWEVQYRKISPEGGFGGGAMRILLSAEGPKRMTSRWVLNNEISHGAYISDVSILGQLDTRRGIMLKRPLYAARIEMNAGRLDVEQEIKRVKFVSRADEPDNYIPEGTIDLVSYLVAKRKTQARFKMILDAQPPSEKGITFVNVDIRVSEINPLSAGGLAAIITVAGQESLCFFDKTGKVEKQIADHTEDVAASEAEIIKAYPEAVTMLKNFKR